MTGRCVFSFLIATTTFGQTFELKDRNGGSVIAITDVKVFRHSDYFGEDIPAFQGTVKNISGEKLLTVSIVGTVHKKDGSVVKFKLDSVCGAFAPCDFPKDFSHEATYPFPQPWPFKRADFDALEFSLETAKRYKTKDGFHVSGFIAQDEGCFHDYLATIPLTGVALRKKLAELVQYGCGFILEQPLAADIGEKKAFSVGGKKVNGVRVTLHDEGILIGLEPSPNAFKSGWTLSSVVIPGAVLTTEEIGAKP